MEAILATGVCAYVSVSVGSAPLNRPGQAELLAIQENTIIALFGPVRAAHLRAPVANTDHELATFSRRNKAMTTLSARGRHAPVDFAPDIIFYTFQQDHHVMLRSPALTERKLEDWAHGFGRWSIPQADDPCNGSDFQNMLAMANTCEEKLVAALRMLIAHPGSPIRPSLRKEINNLMVRFSEFRHSQTERMVEVGLSIAALSPMHEHFRLIRRTFTHDYRSLSGFPQHLDVVIYSQAMVHPSPEAQEDHATRAWAGFYRAFFQGLRGGAPPGPVPPLGGRGATSVVGLRDAQLATPPPQGQSPYHATFDPSLYCTVDPRTGQFSVAPTSARASPPSISGYYCSYLFICLYLVYIHVHIYEQI